MSSSSAWSNQAFDQPQIISLDKAPLSSLISERHLKAYGVDANKINKWFIPLMKNFCTEMNKLLNVKQKISCTHKTGCGVDDTCTLDEVCKNSLDGGFVCREYKMPFVFN